MCFNYVKTSVAVSTTILTKVVFTGFFIFMYTVSDKRDCMYR